MSPQVSTVTLCLMDVREGRVATEGPVPSPVTPPTASSADALR